MIEYNLIMYLYLIKNVCEKIIAFGVKISSHNSYTTMHEAGSISNLKNIEKIVLASRQKSNQIPIAKASAILLTSTSPKVQSF